MNKVKVEMQPSYVQGGGIAIAGLAVAWLLSFVTPAPVIELAIGAVTGGFGVAAAGRIWPGLPLRLMWQYALAVMVYGVVVALIL
ncbi:MAG: hypothetical protein AAFO72_12175 [Pseudomonadota bacterium]